MAEEKISPRLEALLREFQLPTRLPQELDSSSIKGFLRTDKKVWKGKLTFVLLKSIGEPIFFEEPPEKLIDEVLNELSL